MLTNASRFKLLLIAALVVGIPFLIGWLIAYLYYRRKFRLRYL